MGKEKEVRFSSFLRFFRALFGGGANVGIVGAGGCFCAAGFHGVVGISVCRSSRGYGVSEQWDEECWDGVGVGIWQSNVRSDFDGRIRC